MQRRILVLFGLKFNTPARFKMAAVVLALSSALSIPCNAFADILNTPEHRAAIRLIDSSSGFGLRLVEHFDAATTAKCYFGITLVLAWESKGDLVFDSDGKIRYAILYEVVGRAYAHHFGSDRSALESMLANPPVPNNEIELLLGACVVLASEVAYGSQ